MTAEAARRVEAYLPPYHRNWNTAGIPDTEQGREVCKRDVSSANVQAPEERTRAVARQNGNDSFRKGNDESDTNRSLAAAG